LATLPELETSRLTLRRLTLDDADFIVRLLNDAAFLKHIGDRGVRTAADVPQYLEFGPFAMYGRHGFGLWHVARKLDGAPIGMCGLLKRDSLPDVDIGYAYLPEFRGQGYALEAAQASLRHAAGKYGLRRVIAVVSPGNSASIALLEKIGMRFQGMHFMQPGEDEVRLYGRNLDSG
jgi:ribosomal-protein-alanine N-acetyltransferase